MSNHIVYIMFRLFIPDSKTVSHAFAGQRPVEESIHGAWHKFYKKYPSNCADHNQVVSLTLERAFFHSECILFALMINLK